MVISGNNLDAGVATPADASSVRIGDYEASRCSLIEWVYSFLEQYPISCPINSPTYRSPSRQAGRHLPHRHSLTWR
jgi:hypothetical protein